ncbi:MAG: DUF6883 domain-containing protein [Spirulinaceae cyanobacterium]
MKLGDIVNQVTIDPRKLVEYALDPENPRDQDKAFMFQRYLGITTENYKFLIEQISSKILEADAVLGNADQYGQRYNVDLVIMRVETGQQEVIRTAWIVPENSESARLITLYIKTRK